MNIYIYIIHILYVHTYFDSMYIYMIDILISRNSVLSLQIAKLSTK